MQKKKKYIETHKLRFGAFFPWYMYVLNMTNICWLKFQRILSEGKENNFSGDDRLQAQKDYSLSHEMALWFLNTAKCSWKNIHSLLKKSFCWSFRVVFSSTADAYEEEKKNLPFSGLRPGKRNMPFLF